MPGLSSNCREGVVARWAKMTSTTRYKIVKINLQTCKEIVHKTNFHTVVSFFQPKCMVYACFVAKMSKMAFMRFGGQFQFEKSMLGRLDNSGAGPQVSLQRSVSLHRPKR